MMLKKKMFKSKKMEKKMFLLLLSELLRHNKKLRFGNLLKQICY